MASKKTFYKDLFEYSKYHPRYLDDLDLSRKTAVFTRLEPITRAPDFQKALSFEIFDPYWSLARQWQYGRFDGNDCGTPVSIKIRTKKRWFDNICRKDGNGAKETYKYSTDVPLEYEVEKLDVEITPYIRVQSAMYFKKMLKRTFGSKIPSEINKYLLETFSLSTDDFYRDHDDLVDDLKVKNNQALKSFSAAYLKRSFDGFKLYKAIVEKNIKLRLMQTSSPDMKLMEEYKSWFESKYLPNKNSASCWSNDKLGYRAEIHQDTKQYVAEDYDNGRLSWYSFDCNSDKENNEGEEKMLSYIPSPANFTGAPSQKLWEFENTKVNMVADDEKDFSMLATATIMQYISMYSNDWMIVPLETETGVVLDVEGVVIKDSFGERIYIEEDAEDVDDPVDSVEFTDRWNLFGTTRSQAFAEDNFTTTRGLLFPPVVLKTEESSPIEEVQFLRDEMANMVWGVETTINDGCGGIMDGKTLSDAVFRDVDERNTQNEEALTEEASTEKTEDANKMEAEYSLLIQNRVPLNWIPFLPEQLDDFHNIHFRRGRMPLFYDKEFLPVRPATKLLAAEKDCNGCVKPFYIDENQIAGYGTKLVKTAQRCRWFLGKTFNWVGNRTIISEYQANSGLLFDELIPTAKIRKTIEVSDGNEEIGELENTNG